MYFLVKIYGIYVVYFFAPVFLINMIYSHLEDCCMSSIDIMISVRVSLVVNFA